MPGTLKVSNWDRWQSYRTDRGQPPWIKLHRQLLRNHEWAVLSDAAKAHLVSIWMLAADKGGEVPHDAALIKKLCYLDSAPDLDQFIALGFLECPHDASVTTNDDATATPRRRHGDATVSNQRREETEKRQRREETEKRQTDGARTRAPARATGRRWGDDEHVPEEWRIEVMDGLGMDRRAVDMQADAFGDYWRAAAGAKAVKRDWRATWRNWCRRAVTDFAGSGRGPPGGGRHPGAIEQFRQMHERGEI